jgi:hypothetical protein
VKKSVLTILFACTMVACANKKPAKSSSAETNDATKPTASLSKGYQFEVNGCNTGFHRFTGATSDETIRQYCDALQDQTLNNSCAEWVRRSSFNDDCPGMTWRQR